MKKFLSFLLTLLLLTGCTAILAEDTVGETASPFVVAAATELSGMFFTGLWGNNTSDIDVRAMIYNYSPVVWSDQTSMEMNPLVVADVSVGEYDNGNRAYVITLQDDLVYSDGTPILASDYVFSLMLQASPFMTLLGGVGAVGQQITGYDAYHSGEADAFYGLRIENERTFVIQVDADYYPFFYELSYLDVIPYPMHVIAPGCRIVDTNEGATIRNIDPEAVDPIFTPELLAQTILDPDTGYRSHPSVVSGAYMLANYDSEARVATFEINPYFKGSYDGILPTISPIEYRSVDSDGLRAGLESGEIHLVNRTVSGDMINWGLSLVSQGQVNSSNYPRMGFGYLSFACEGEIFSHEAVRKAVAYAFDKTAFLQAFTPYAVPVYGYMGVGQWLYTAVTAEDGASFAETDEERAAWKVLTLDNLNHYDMNLETAERLLIEDGWTFNAQGGPYVKGTDTVRHKMADGDLTALSIRWGKTIGSSGADIVAELLPGPLAEIGIELIIIETSFQDVLRDFYSQQDREYDMHMLASNVSNLFDPSPEYNTERGNARNTTGLHDEELESLAFELRDTTPGALLEYATKWVQFQEYWNDRLPMLPLYSNIYFDFFTPELVNYRPDAEQNWPEAIARARIELPTAEDDEAAAEDDDFEFQIIE